MLAHSHIGSMLMFVPAHKYPIFTSAHCSMHVFILPFYIVIVYMHLILITPSAALSAFHLARCASRSLPRKAHAALLRVRRIVTVKKVASNIPR